MDDITTCYERGGQPEWDNNDYQRDFVWLGIRRDLMLPHQERVVKELKDLDEKIDKLTIFLKGDIFHTLSMDEQGRLNQQLVYMRGYSTILSERIGAF